MSNFALIPAFTARSGKRLLVVIVVAAVLAASMFAVTPRTVYAGDATSPSACGTCSG